MEPISNQLSINKAIIDKAYGGCTDIFTRTLEIGNKKIMYVLLESVSSDDKLSNFLMKSISSDIKHNLSIQNLKTFLENTIPNSKIKLTDNFEEIYTYLSSGFTCLFINNENKVIAIETKSTLDRSVSESSIEPIIRGPKDSFTENYMTNIGLIRKRIKDEKLWFDEIKIGRRTKTKVAIAYLNDVASLKNIENIKNKLTKIDIDGILDSGYIREFLNEEQESSFPKMLSTERPDLVCNALLEGKIVIMVENTPMALVIPGLLTDYFHSPEDYYQKPINATFTRILRFMAFFITILTPALYIAIMTFNQEMIPDHLLLSLASQKQGVPFPTSFEVLLLILTFEILRESDIRKPSVMGTSVSVVGALVLGDAAVSAGIVSPIAVIIVAITSICGLLFSDIDVINAIRNWRLFFLLLASIAGMIGILIAGIIFITELVSLESMGIPYLSPYSPLNIEDQKDSIIRFPRTKLIHRPHFLTKKNPHRKGKNI